MPGTDPIGLFIASYEVGTGLPGAPLLHLRLVVSTPERKVTGVGTITQAVNAPQPRFATSLYGSYAYLALMPPAPTNVVVSAFGLPLGAPETSSIAATAHLEMLLDESWQGGVASFRYLLDGKTWHEIENGRVRRVQPDTIDAIAPAEINLDKPKARAKAGKR